MSPRSPNMSPLESALKQWIVTNATGNKLPTTLLPEVARRANELASNPRASFSDMEKLIRQDSVIAARVLQVANSPMYPKSSAIESLHQAIVRIGFHGARNVALMVTMGGQIAGADERERLHGLWEHSIAVAVAAEALSKRLGFPPDNGFLAGLLHDIGKVIAYSVFGRFLRAQKEKDIPPEVVDATIDSIHTSLGAFLVKRWQIDEHIVSAIENHHEPPSERKFETMIAYADLIADQGGWASRPGRRRLEALEEIPYYEALALQKHEVDLIKDKLRDDVEALVSLSK